MTRTKVYSLEQSPLYRLRNKRKLAALLGVSPQNLRKIKNDNSYKEYSKKQNDKIRRIQAPKPKLKQLQKSLKKFLQRIETPDWLISGKKGNSFVTNAKQHSRSKHLLKVDIKNFYPNSNRRFVFKFFKKDMQMAEDVAWLVTDILTYKNFIPIGSPASQMLAYLAYASTFCRIKKIADTHNSIFSLYVDDLTFSSKVPISKKIPYLVEQELKKVSHQLKKRKTKFFSSSQYKPVTGCMVSPDGVLKVPNKVRLKIKEEEKKYLKAEQINLHRMLGRILSARQIEPNLYQERYIDLKSKVFKKKKNS